MFHRHMLTLASSMSSLFLEPTLYYLVQIKCTQLSFMLNVFVDCNGSVSALQETLLTHNKDGRLVLFSETAVRV
jgi:hypothetical protein